jgi:hypothetical protein
MQSVIMFLIVSMLSVVSFSAVSMLSVLPFSVPSVMFLEPIRYLIKRTGFHSNVTLFLVKNMIFYWRHVYVSALCNM